MTNEKHENEQAAADAEHELQRECDAYVRDNVFYNAGEVFEQLAKLEEFQDDAAELLSRDDWKETARDAVLGADEKELADAAEVFDVSTAGVEMTHAARLSILDDMAESASYQDVAEELGEDDPQRSEAFEHWIVSDSLYRELSDRGEIVGELCGMQLWGRCTSGQAISMDDVIRSIIRDRRAWFARLEADARRADAKGAAA